MVHRITGCRLTLTLALAAMLTVLTAGCGQSTTLNVTPTPTPTGAPAVVSAPDEAQPATAMPTVTPPSMTGPTPAVTGPAPGGSPVVSSGGAHTCLLTPNGELSCWGSNEVGESSPPSGESFSAVSAGGWHTCALRENGSSSVGAPGNPIPTSGRSRRLQRASPRSAAARSTLARSERTGAHPAGGPTMRRSMPARR